MVSLSPLGGGVSILAPLQRVPIFGPVSSYKLWSLRPVGIAGQPTDLSVPAVSRSSDRRNPEGLTQSWDPSRARYFVRHVRTDDNGCWTWTGGKTWDGYGLFNIPTRGTVKAHRFAYEAINGSIPDGLEIDHLCRNRACVRPSHLEAVTRRINLLRGNTIQAAYAARTHCNHGHPFDDANTVIEAGWRRCRTCKRAANAQYDRKRQRKRDRK